MSALAIASGIFAHFIVGAHLATNNPPKGVDAAIFLIAIFGESSIGSPSFNGC